MSALSYFRALPRSEQIITAIGIIAGLYGVTAGAWSLL